MPAFLRCVTPDIDTCRRFDYPKITAISILFFGKMTDSYRGLAIFVAVNEAGSFSAAGRRLKLSTSVVSHHISNLEKTLGTPLFFRSTRSLTLTTEGQKILDAAQRMVAAAEEALDTLSDESEQPTGSLRISMPAFGLNSTLHTAVWQFARAHPLVAISLHNSDKPVDLIREGYDLAIRLGHLTDSTLKNRRIGTFDRMIVASPAYLANRANIKDIDELVECDFISLAMVPDRFIVRQDGEDLMITLQNVRLEVDSVSAGRAAVREGLGLMSMPVDEIEEDLKSGAIVEVSDRWKLPSLGVYAVWTDTGGQKKLTRRLIDYLAEQN